MITDKLRQLTPEDGGNMSIMQVDRILWTHGLQLAQVTVNHDRKGGREYNLLQERLCKLVICLRLITLNGGHAHHCIGWDEQCLYNHPHNVIVNNRSDRRNMQSCVDVFNRLYPPQNTSRNGKSLKYSD